LDTDTLTAAEREARTKALNLEKRLGAILQKALTEHYKTHKPAVSSAPSRPHPTSPKRRLGRDGKPDVDLDEFQKAGEFFANAWVKRPPFEWLK